ncbi:MAG: DUF4197 domain-containing protein [Burkholderiales bacterium]|nr:DUF4197 domain-containing protein [Burkholderiales bacterium]
MTDPVRRRLLSAATLGLVGITVPGMAFALSVEQLRDREVATALRQALELGAVNAVTQLGQLDGYLGNAAVRIAMPESLQRAESAMRKFGLGKQADELVTTMNRAAEQAVPEARKLLVDTVRKLTIDDAKRILTGPDDAATQFFRSQTETELVRRFLPIVARETKRLRLADYWNRFAAKGVQFGLVREQDADLDRYVTEQALDGLFRTLAVEEKAIRANPADAGRKLVTKVFGTLLGQ